MKSIIECPFEFIKVNQQTGQDWKFKDIYKGFGSLYLRTTGMLMWYFVNVDLIQRSNIFGDYRFSSFFISGSAASISWAFIWPFENLKNIVQVNPEFEKQSNLKNIKWMIETNGITGIYRGALPGILGIFIRNGSSMIIMQEFNKKINKYITKH